MSGSRERDSSDLDLETFVDLFDTALASDNPAVKRALKNLLMISALIDSNTRPEDRVQGPLRRLVDDLRNLSRRLDRVEGEQQVNLHNKVYGPGSVPAVWITNSPTTGNPSTYPYPSTGISHNNYTLTGITSIDDYYSLDQNTKKI